MVVKGNFRVSLVEAKSKQPFQEHTRSDDGEVFVEVEPDAEYFIEVDVVGGEAGKMYDFECYLDGEELDVVIMSEDEGPYSFGYAVSDGNGKLMRIPIRLVQSKPMESENPQSALRAEFLMGNVIVQISESIEGDIGYNGETFKKPDKPYACEDLSNPREHQSSATRHCPKLANSQKQKILRSAPGSECPQERPPISLCVKGAPLQEIKVHYCTAVGLIQVGILPKPPLWDMHKRRHPRNPALEGILPPVERIQVGAVMAGNVQISAARDVEIFDLT